MTFLVIWLIVWQQKQTKKTGCRKKSMEQGIHPHTTTSLLGNKAKKIELMNINYCHD